MEITLINPPERLRVWAGIPKAHAHGVYCFPPLGLMHIQAGVEKRSHYVADICDPVVDDLDYPDFEQMLKRYPLDLVGISTYTHSLPDVQMTINLGVNGRIRISFIRPCVFQTFFVFTVPPQLLKNLLLCDHSGFC